jgi:hypothetical protein
MKILALLLLFTLVSCAQQRVRQKVSQLNSQMNPLLGSSEETVVRQLGAPMRVDEIAGYRVYRYHQSYGQRSVANFNAYSNPYSNPYGGVSVWGQGQSWDTYDTINIYFRNGIMEKWDGYVQR